MYMYEYEINKLVVTLFRPTKEVCSQGELHKLIYQYCIIYYDNIFIQYICDY